MRAVIIPGYGGLENVAVAEVDRPTPEAPDDVIVGVRAAALNHLDLFVVAGLPGVTHRFPHVLGCDAAGVVEATGSAVTRVRAGDRVVINPGVWCRHCEFCLRGEEQLCTTYRVLGEHLPGTFAEAVRVREDALEPLPDGVSWTDAAAFPLATLTAWHMVKARGAVTPGQTVLIWGIGGGVALAALQAAKLLGASVIVTSSSDEKLARAKTLGADEGINHATADVAKEVRRLTSKRGCDVVIDNVGERTWDASQRCLVRGGRLVTCGGTSGPMVTTDVRKLFWHQWSLLGSTMGSRGEFAEITARLGRGELRPVVDRVYPLGEARAALERLQQGGQFGKLVLDTGMRE
jgi:NADPH:quinone reductase-like Zn-dependent oxidoreductase